MTARIPQHPPSQSVAAGTQHGSEVSAKAPEIAHSPGPWDIEPNQVDGDSKFGLLGSDGLYVATVHLHTETPKNANRRLIAAAPELLAFAVKHRKEIVCVCRINKVAALLGAGIDCTACELDELIAKATGGAK